MKRVLIVVCALVLIAAIIPAASAYGEYAGNVTAPHWFNTTNSEANALCAVYGTTYAGGWIGVNEYTSAWAGVGSTGAPASYNQYINPFQPTTTYIAHVVTCTNSTQYWLRYYMKGTVWPIFANFTGSPTEGTGPLSVVLTDTSTNLTGVATFNWTITPATGWYVTAGTINSQNLEVALVTNGNYSVSHGVTDGAQSGIKIRNDYIWVYNSTSLETTYFDVNDIVDGYAIHGADIGLYDIENASWTNSTADADGILGITTLAGHHINGYATATGYQPGEKLNAVTWNNVHYAIMMQPTDYYNVTEGNVTLHVRVEDDMFQPISMAGVSAQKGGGPSFTVMTNTAGTVNLPVQNNSIYRVKAEKSGYESATQSVSTGTGSGGEDSVSVTLILYRKTVTPTVTATTIPGGGTPTVTITEDPYPCVGDGSAQDTENCKRKQGEMGASLISYGPQLLMLFIVLTFVGGVKLIGK